jgi:hypothetical protein
MARMVRVETSIAVQDAELITRISGELGIPPAAVARLFIQHGAAHFREHGLSVSSGQAPVQPLTTPHATIQRRPDVRVVKADDRSDADPDCFHAGCQYARAGLEQCQEVCAKRK